LRLVIALLLVPALVLSAAPAWVVAAGTSPAGTPGTASESDAEFIESPCWWDLPRNLEEGEDIVCGVVTVPLFHDDPDGETAQLAVGVINPDVEDPVSDPVFMLNGGPGGDSAVLVEFFAPSSFGSYAPILEDRTVVVFDQRGTGYSSPGLFCPGDIEPGEDEPLPGAEDIADDDIAGYAQACVDQFEDEDIDLEAFTTTESAYDILSISQALGFDSVSLWGQSYGTRLALEAMRVLPEDAISSVVLESVVAPDQPFLATATIGFSDSLRLAFELCADDADCDDAFPDLEQTYADVLATLEDEPYESSFEDLTTGEETDVAVDPNTFNSILYQMLFSGILVGQVPALIALTDAGVYEALDTLLPLLSTTSSATGTYFSVSCQDWLAFESADAYEDEVAEADVIPGIEEYGSGLDPQGYLDICDVFDLEASDEDIIAPVESDIPALLVSGAFDPITPPSGAEQVAETLPNSYVVTDPVLGHTPIGFSEDCLMAGTIDFLADPAEEPDFSCVDEETIEFLVP
jgi:pimeloyl-ACP methyl ester carboxylesterase